MPDRITDLADAYEAVARVNHYMVGVVETITDDELDGAYSHLITRQNAAHPTSKRYATLELALDIIEHEKQMRYYAVYPEVGP